jgi:tripeptide aminopeptidase
MNSKVVETFLELIEIDSLSKNEKKMAEKIIEKLETIGVKAYIDDAGPKTGGNCGNVIARIPGTAQKPSLLFMAHMDTVTPGIGKKGIIKDGYIESAGDTILGADDIAGVAIILTAVENAIKENIDRGDINIAFTVGEELRLLGARYLEMDAIKSDYGFILDSDGDVGTIVLKAPSHECFEITLKGKAAHAGIEPEKGISAIKVAADAISKINFGRVDEETTSNIGVIEGGKATNIVCDEVFIKGEVRSHSPEKLNEQIEYIKKNI